MQSVSEVEKTRTGVVSRKGAGAEDEFCCTEIRAGRKP